MPVIICVSWREMESIYQLPDFFGSIWQQKVIIWHFPSRFMALCKLPPKARPLCGCLGLESATKMFPETTKTTMHLAPQLTSARLAICVGKRTLWNCSDVSPGCGSENGRGRTQRRPYWQRCTGGLPADTDLWGKEPRQERGRFVRCLFPSSGIFRESRGEQPGLADSESREDAARVGYEAAGPAAERRGGFRQPRRHCRRSPSDEKGGWDDVDVRAVHVIGPPRSTRLGKLSLCDDANRLAGPGLHWRILNPVLVPQTPQRGY